MSGGVKAELWPAVWVSSDGHFMLSDQLYATEEEARHDLHGVQVVKLATELPAIEVEWEFYRRCLARRQQQRPSQSSTPQPPSSPSSRKSFDWQRGSFKR